MAKQPLPVSRSRVSIGGATATFDETAAGADTYVIVEGVRTIGAFGDSFQVISVDEVNDGRTRKAKGTANAGTMELMCSRLVDDPGQVAMVAAAEAQDAFNVKIEVPIGGGVFETTYISALVMSKSRGMGGPNDSQTISFNLELTEAPIEVAVV